MPLAEPVAVGAKVTVNVTLCFGESVIGKLNPLAEKPVPLTFAAEIVTAVPPLLVNFSERLELVLFCTLPKESVDDEAASVELPLEMPEAIPWQPLSSAIPAAINREVSKQRHHRRTCKARVIRLQK
ncbi:MAG TPA: hypothetical protein VF845_01290 [Terriglobales bacterium]